MARSNKGRLLCAHATASGHCGLGAGRVVMGSDEGLERREHVCHNIHVEMSVCVQNWRIESMH